MLDEKTVNIAKKFPSAAAIVQDMQHTEHEAAMTKARRDARRKGIEPTDSELENDPALLERSLSSDFAKFGNL